MYPRPSLHSIYIKSQTAKRHRRGGTACHRLSLISFNAPDLSTTSSSSLRFSFHSTFVSIPSPRSFSSSFCCFNFYFKTWRPNWITSLSRSSISLLIFPFSLEIQLLLVSYSLMQLYIHVAMRFEFCLIVLTL